MNGLDVALLALLAVAAALGLSAGIVRVALSLVSLVAGAVLALALAEPAARLWRTVVAPDLALLLGFISVFALVLIVFSLLALALRGLLRKVGLGWADRAFGALAGAAAVAAAGALLALALERAEVRHRLVRGSRLLPPLGALAEGAAEALPPGWKAEGGRMAVAARGLWEGRRDQGRGAGGKRQAERRAEPARERPTGRR